MPSTSAERIFEVNKIRAVWHNSLARGTSRAPPQQHQTAHQHDSSRTHAIAATANSKSIAMANTAKRPAEEHHPQTHAIKQ